MLEGWQTPLHGLTPTLDWPNISFRPGGLLLVGSDHPVYGTPGRALFATKSRRISGFVVLQRKSGALLGSFVAEERQNVMGLVMDLSEEESPDTTTALHQDDFLQAARYGDLEDVRAGLAQGISVDCQDVQGRTALHMAAANGHLDIAKLLLDHGAELMKSVGSHGSSLLLFVMNVKGANSCNMEQNTPLHYAVLNGQKQVVELLISQGANVSAVNRYERTPVDEAISKGDNSLVEYISRSVPIPEQPEGTQDSTDMDES